MSNSHVFHKIASKFAPNISSFRDFLPLKISILSFFVYSILNSSCDIDKILKHNDIQFLFNLFYFRIHAFTFNMPYIPIIPSYNTIKMLNFFFQYNSIFGIFFPSCRVSSIQHHFLPLKLFSWLFFPYSFITSFSFFFSKAIFLFILEMNIFPYTSTAMTSSLAFVAISLSLTHFLVNHTCTCTSMHDVSDISLDHKMYSSWAGRRNERTNACYV